MEKKLVDIFTKHGEVLADTARSFIRKSISHNPIIKFKDDGSPVTNYDKDIVANFFKKKIFITNSL